MLENVNWSVAALADLCILTAAGSTVNFSAGEIPPSTLFVWIEKSVWTKKTLIWPYNDWDRDRLYGDQCVGFPAQKKLIVYFDLSQGDKLKYLNLVNS